MQSVINCIKNYDLINENDIIGVAVSGGSDSMALLHFLQNFRKHLDFDIVALHVDHNLRDTSKRDADFVAKMCSEYNIKLLSSQVNVSEFCKKTGRTIEDGARELRYKFFNQCIQDKLVTKIALAHHMKDQAETVLLHILRGSGLQGACGMQEQRNYFIRPLLHTSKYEILAYIKANNLKYMHDETNDCTDYTRNFLRNEIFPILENKFPSFEKNLCSFADNCKEEHNYICSNIDFNQIIKKNNEVKIPLEFFKMNISLIYRSMVYALNLLGNFKDFEKRHLELLCNLVKNSTSGSKINLAHNIVAYKDYNHLTLAYDKLLKTNEQVNFKPSEYNVENFGQVNFIKINNLNEIKDKFSNIFDLDKLPKNCVIRTRKEGDLFIKFGGGTKKLKDYLIDKKIPQRYRDFIPLIAKDNIIYAILGIDISELIKYDQNTKNYIGIEVKQDTDILL